MKKMVLDVDYAFHVYVEKQKKEGIKVKSKKQFLDMIPMSYECAKNYQKAKSDLKVIQFAEQLKELTGLSLDKLIRPFSSDLGVLIKGKKEVGNVRFESGKYILKGSWGELSASTEDEVVASAKQMGLIYKK